MKLCRLLHIRGTLSPALQLGLGFAAWLRHDWGLGACTFATGARYAQ